MRRRRGARASQPGQATRDQPAGGRSGLRGVPDRVQDDMGDAVVGEGVLDLTGVAAGRDDAGAPQHAQVLGDQRLADAEGGYGLRCTRLPPAASSRTMPSRTGDASALSSSLAASRVLAQRNQWEKPQSYEKLACGDMRRHVPWATGGGSGNGNCHVAAARPASPVIASVLVPAPVMGRVPVPVVQEVGVPLVRHRDVAAARPVLVGVALVGRVAGLLAHSST